MLFRDGPEVPAQLRGQDAVLGCLPLLGDLAGLDAMVGKLTFGMEQGGLAVIDARVRHRGSLDLARAIGSTVARCLTDDYPELALAFAGGTLELDNPLYNPFDQLFHKDGEKGPPPSVSPKHLRITIGGPRNPHTDAGIYGTVVTTDPALDKTRTPGVTSELPSNCWRAPNNHVLILDAGQLLHGAPTYPADNKDEMVVYNNDRIAVIGGLSEAGASL
jgi:hypothetical protein